ncbi:MAG TPA: hypothetical protein VM871_09845 [Flavisolibacter sp.]|jgi:hypothetical protein|nr:hypothetical protein [Flavisolibacter sp.]
MNRTSRLLFFLLLLSGVAGYLLSKASFVGKAGISLFYRQYRFLKVWWQGGLLIFVVWLLLFFLHRWATQKLTEKASKLLHSGAVVVAIAGLYFTYQDFRDSLAHRWLGERFHIGGYLFWLGWVVIGVFFLTAKKSTGVPSHLSTGNDASSWQVNKTV